MITIGLVGGVACGKSLVAGQFQTLGAYVLNGDRVGHEVLLDEGVRKRVFERWGERVLNDQGQLDRSAIARFVFSGSKKAAQELMFLESVTHPEISRRLELRLEQTRKLGRFPVAILDAAIMLKAGWDKFCDRIVFIDVPRPLRLRRAQTRGLNEAQFTAREAAQTPLEETRNRADLVIDNSGNPQQTFRQVQQVWHNLVEIA